MRNRLIGVVLTALTLAVVDVAQAGGDAPRWARMRPLTATATAMLVDAITRSTVVDSLVKDLEKNNVVVYLTDAMSGMEGEPATYLRFVSYAAGLRYVLVRIDRWRLLSSFERTIGIGHELQHALEIAGAPEVRDSGGLARLYRQIGWESGVGRFETDRARTAGRRVRSELEGHSAAPHSFNSKNAQLPPGTARSPQ
jgi:hypothetical protein